MNNSEVNFILGGSGFLGIRLKSYFDRKNRRYYSGDLNDSIENTIKLDIRNLKNVEHFAHSNCIINLAAVHRDNVKPESLYDDVNIQGSVNVCNVARKNNIKKIIFTSSVAIYGFADEDTDESGEPNYFNDYGRTKYFAEQVYKEWHAEDPLNRTLVIIRPTVIFGEGNRGNVYNLLKQISSRRFLMLGNGLNKKSMAYVENVVAFIEFSMSLPQGLHIFNYIDKPDLDMNTLVKKVRNTLFKKNNVGIRIPAFLGVFIGYFADLISKVTGKNLSISSIRVKKFLSTSKFESSIKNTSFRAPFSLEEGLRKTLEYEFFQENSKLKTFNEEQ